MAARVDQYGRCVFPSSPSFFYSEEEYRRPELERPPPLTAEEERQLDLARELLESVKYPPPTPEQRLAEKMMHEVRATEFWRRQREASHKLEHWLKQFRGGSR